MLTAASLVIIFLAGAAAGFINALAGGGTLISFPVLTAVGIPPVSANITNTVALSPGYLGATYAQIKDLAGQRKRVLLLLPFSAAGGVTGGILLLNTGEKLFAELVPYLILLASLLLAIQEPVKKILLSGKRKQGGGLSNGLTVILVFAASVYGGYFGAGLSIIILAALGLTIDDNLTRLNALKQSISFTVNITAAIFFIFTGKVVWLAVLVMIPGAITGGIAGGKFAGIIKAAALRTIVVITGIVVSILYFLL